MGRKLSDWWRRVVAYLLDGLFLWSIYLVVFLPLGLLLLSGGEVSLVFLFLFLLFFASIAILVLYYGLAMSRKGERNGQSLGKQVLGICVIREDGQEVDFFYAIKRQVIVMQLLFGFVFSIFTSGIATFLDFLWPLWDDKRQCLHDKMVSSRVAFARKTSPLNKTGVGSEEALKT